MFDIGAPEFLVLAIAALFIFGPDRLPDAARQAARGLKQVRSMATSARRQFTQELGPEFGDLNINDLNPRSFIRRHVLDDLEDDVDIRDDLRVDLNGHDDSSYDGSSYDDDDDETYRTGADGAPTASKYALPPFDPEAT
ncbi:MAG: sec-independent translocase [Nocardioidaceae bacterium]